MLTVPELNGAQIAFGNIDHLPAYSELPEDFRRERHPACNAVGSWFFGGCKKLPNGIEIDGKKWIARDGVDCLKALRAISAALRSFEPKHEHKIAGCGYLLNEWFSPAA